METVDNNSWITALRSMGEKLGKSIETLKQNFIDQCNSVQTFIVDGVTPSFQGY